MESACAYRLLVLAPTATKEEVQAAFDAEAALLNPDRFANVTVELREHAEKRLHFVTEAYKTVQRQLNFGGSGFSTSPTNTPHIPHPKYDMHNFDPNVIYSMPELKVKPLKMDLDWLYFAIGIVFLVAMLFSKTITQAVLYLIVAVVASLFITLVKRAQR